MKYKVGDEVKIVQCLHGHGHDFGDLVVITDVYEACADYRVDNVWWVKDDEIELIKSAE